MGHTGNEGIDGKLLSHHFGAIFDHYDFSKLQHSRFCKEGSPAKLILLAVPPLTLLCPRSPHTRMLCTPQLPLPSTSPTAEEVVVSEFKSLVVCVLSKVSEPTRMFKS